MDWFVRTDDQERPPVATIKTGGIDEISSVNLHTIGLGDENFGNVGAVVEVMGYPIVTDIPTDIRPLELGPNGEIEAIRAKVPERKITIPPRCPTSLWEHAKSILFDYASFCRSCSKVIDEEGYKEFVLPLEKYSRESGLRIVVIATDGVVMFDSSRINNTYSNYQYRPRKVDYVVGTIGYNHGWRACVLRAQQMGAGVEVKRSNTLGSHQIYLAVRLGDKYNNVGTLRVSRDLTEQEKDELIKFSTTGLV